MNEAAYWLYNNIFKVGQTQTMVPVKFEMNVHQACCSVTVIVFYCAILKTVCVCVAHEISEEMKLQGATSYYKAILFMHN